MIRNLFSLFPLLFLTACLSSTEVKEFQPEETPVDFTKRLVKEMSHKLDKVVAPLDNKLVEYDTYYSFNALLFPVNGKIDGVKQSFANYCNNIGGIVQANACKKNVDSDQVLFLAGIFHTGNRQSTKEVGIRLIAPKEGIALDNVNYQTALMNNGYKSVYVQQQEELKKIADDAERDRRITMAKVARQALLPEIKTIGTKLCVKQQSRVGYTTTYIGYVERVDGDNIQIRVASAYVGNSRNLSPGGFKEHVVWVSASESNWNPC